MKFYPLKSFNFAVFDNFKDKTDDEFIILAFENDMQRYGKKLNDCEYPCEVGCNECLFTTNSFGRLRKHENSVHDAENTSQEILESFNVDEDEYKKFLANNYDEEEFGRFRCERCNYKSHSEANVKLHENKDHLNFPSSWDQ